MGRAGVKHQLAAGTCLPLHVSPSSPPYSRPHAARCPAPQPRAAIALIVVFSLLGQAVADALGLPVPGGVIGMALVLLLLATRRLRVRNVHRGASWLLGEMLLFFIPAVLAVVQYRELVRHQGWRICAVIALSTLAVMVVTALVVEQVYRLELRLARRASNATRNGQQRHA